MKNGILLSNRKLKFHKLGYAGFGLLTILVTVVIFSLNIHFKKTEFGLRQNKTIGVGALIWIMFCITVLIISLARSLCLIYRASKSPEG